MALAEEVPSLLADPCRECMPRALLHQKLLRG